MLGKTIVGTLVIRKQTSCDTSFHQIPLPGLVLRIILDREKINFIIVFTSREDTADLFYVYIHSFILLL